MKEDIDKHLENLIIDSLIKEAEQDNADFEATIRNLSDDEFNKIVEPKQHKSMWIIFRPWMYSMAAAAAIVLIVLIPCINAMNARLCDGALYVSANYMTCSKGGLDVANVPLEELKDALPELERAYYECCNARADTEVLQQAGWDLTVAYLRLHKKDKAKETLQSLLRQDRGTVFGNHCIELLRILN